MAYIDKSFFDAVYPNSEITTNDFNLLVDVSSNIVNRATVGKINAFGLTNFTNTLQTKIQNATAHQVNMIEENGGLIALIGSSDLNSGSLTVGRYSESFGQQGNYQGTLAKIVEGVPISPLVNLVLFGTGLLDKACKYYSLEDINARNS